MKNIITIITFVLLAFFVGGNIVYSASQSKETCNIVSVKASHILVEQKEMADAIKSRIDKGENFESLAKKYSFCPSGENGGDLGYFERGEMVKEFEDVAFSLPVGAVSNPVKTAFGWHIIKIYDKK